MNLVYCPNCGSVYVQGTTECKHCVGTLLQPVSVAEPASVHQFCFTCHDSRVVPGEHGEPWPCPDCGEEA